MSLWNKVKNLIVKPTDEPAAQQGSPTQEASEPAPQIASPQPQRQEQQRPHARAFTGAAMQPQTSSVTPQPKPRPVHSEPKVDLDKFKNRKFMELSTFQFKNLISKPVMFAFFDLRDQTTSIVRVAKAMPITPEEAFESISKYCPNFDYPIVIICEDGTKSSALAERLADTGYKNVAILKGGMHWLTNPAADPIPDEDD